MKLMAGNSNLPLARAIAAYLEIELTDASVRRFADEEIFIEIHENVRGEDVFIMQSTSYPANDNLMELLIAIDACRRASAKRITAVMPYFGYARQDRKPGPRTPISAKLVANLITEAGQSRAFGRSPRRADPGLFRYPTDNLMPPRRCRRYPGALRRDRADGRLAASAAWSAPRAGQRLDNAPAGDRRQAREQPGESEVMNIIGVCAAQLHPGRRYRRVPAARCATRRRPDGRRGQKRRRLHHPWCALWRRVARVDSSR